MLKINLLPIRQLKKRAKARNQILAALIVFCGVLAILAFVGIYQTSIVSALEQDIQVKQKERDQYQKFLADMQKLEKTEQDLQNKINTINKLEADSSIAVHVLDQVAKRIDNNRMWLTSLAQSGNRVTITGYALDNETVAQFMDTLNDAESADIATMKTLEELSGKLDELSEQKPATEKPVPQDSGKETASPIKSDYIRFSSVSLSSSSLQQVAGRELKAFTLTCIVTSLNQGTDTVAESAQ